MSLFLILFFISLAGIVFMIVRSLLFLKYKEIPLANENGFFTEILDFEKLKKISVKSFKKGGHTLIWVTLRTYLISSSFLNKKRKEISKKVKEKIQKYGKHHRENQSSEESSKYLKMISEYRQKIKRLKHRIKEEEGIE